MVLPESVSQIVEASREIFVSFGALGLFVLAFIESSFFPIPPDVVLIPLAVASPESAVFYGVVTTIGSVAGAVFGYYAGYKGGRPLLEATVDDEKMELVEDYYDEYGVAAVGIAGLSPIPYKVFTLSSGAFRMDLRGFILVSVVSRGARFIGVAVLLSLYGEEILGFIEGSFGVLTIGFGVIAAAAYVVWKKRWFKR
ncbi:YqaA family protein [Halorutilales archaeon Cl-col2-1]